MSSQWRPAGAFAWAARSTVAMLRLASSHSRGSTKTAARSQTSARAERSTWRQTRSTNAVAVTRSYDKTIWVDDVINAHCAVLGTREHAISLLDGIATAVAEAADAMQINGDQNGSKEMVFLVASCMDVLDQFLGLEDAAA